MENSKKFRKMRYSWSQDKKDAYIKEGHYCENCGKLLIEWFGSGQFCSRACANSRNQTDEIKQKISVGINHWLIENNISTQESKNLHLCKNCAKKLRLTNKTGYCKNCYRKHWHEWATVKMVESSIQAGKKSAYSQERRSKNEVAFYELCNNFFKSVKHNEPIFNGWDADIIIEDLNIAILWNGIWHYKQISKQQSLLQVQSRDKIKIKQILDKGYFPYIIQDLGKYNIDKVKLEFEILLNFIQLNYM